MQIRTCNFKDKATYLCPVLHVTTWGVLGCTRAASVCTCMALQLCEGEQLGWEGFGSAGRDVWLRGARFCASPQTFVAPHTAMRVYKYIHAERIREAEHPPFLPNPPCRAVLEASPPALPQPAARPRGSGPCAKRVQISARPALLVPVAPRCGGGAAGSWAPNHRASGLVLGWVLFPLLHNSLSCPLPSHPCPLTMGATICKTAFLSRTL